MPIYTPRGLRLRLRKDYAFALMGRLHGKESAFKILQLTEAVENLGGFVTTIAAAGAVYYSVTPWEMAGICFGASILMTLVSIFGLFISPITFLIPPARVYSVLSGYGIIFIGLCALLYFAGGIWLVAAMLGGRLVGWIAGGILNMIQMKIALKHTGLPISASERSFFHAYRLMANKHGISTSLTVTDDESSPDAWMPSYQKLAMEWPMVVARFSEE